MVTFAEEILNGKLHFCAVRAEIFFKRNIADRIWAIKVKYYVIKVGFQFRISPHIHTFF